MQNGFSFKNLSENLSKNQKTSLVIFIVLILFLSVTLIFGLQTIAPKRTTEENSSREASKETESHVYTESKEDTQNGFKYSSYFILEDGNKSLMYNIDVNNIEKTIILTTDKCNLAANEENVFNYLNNETDIDIDVYTITYNYPDPNIKCLGL